jgi:hypothetical protein
LKLVSKYKTFISALLLAVYAFMATPVPLWHRHNYEANTVTEKSAQEKELASFSKFSLQAVNTNCQICSHQYSIFIDTEMVRIEAPFVVNQSVEQHYVFSIPLSPSLHFSNKDPPALSQLIFL